MSANLKNSAVATRLEKVSFHSNPQERQCQRMLKLSHNCTHLTQHNMAQPDDKKIIFSMVGVSKIIPPSRQILKHDAVKVLHSICQQIWKTQQWPQDWKRSVFIPIPKKGNEKVCSNYCIIVLISHTSKVMLKILQARLQ